MDGKITQHKGTGSLATAVREDRDAGRGAGSGKTSQQVLHALRSETSLQETKHAHGEGHMGKSYRVKCNFARSRALVLGPSSELVLKFDNDGVAKCPEHMVQILKQEMRSKPGRFKFLDSPEPASAGLPELPKPLEIAEADMAAEELKNRLASMLAKMETPPPKEPPAPKIPPEVLAKHEERLKQQEAAKTEEVVEPEPKEPTVVEEAKVEEVKEEPTPKSTAPSKKTTKKKAPTKTKRGRPRKNPTKTGDE